LIDIICKLLYPFSSSFISSCCKSKIEEVKVMIHGIDNIFIICLLEKKNWS